MGTLFHYNPLHPSTSVFTTKNSCFHLKQLLPVKQGTNCCCIKRTETKMAAAGDAISSHPEQNPAIRQQKIIVQNNHGEKLVGLLHETGSTDIVILCHGFQSTKESNTLMNLSSALEKEGISVFRFDFAGNGESEGSFQYGNYRREADDLHSVIQHFNGNNRVTSAILGHSKGGNVVLLYASKYHDVHRVINVSGRYNTAGGVEERLGKGYLQKVREDGYIDVKSKTGEVLYRVTEESLMDRLNTNMHEACLQIHKDCKVLSIHGSDDSIVGVEEALEFAKIIPNHKLHIIEEFQSNSIKFDKCNPNPTQSTKAGSKRRTKLKMASANLQQNLGVEQQKVIIENKCGEKLAGLLHETGSKEIVILCHGLHSTKEYSMMVELCFALEKQGISAFRFDFSGNGESEGSFEFGNYRKEVDDLHSVIQHFTAANRVVSAIIGHSKGGNAVILYSSLHHNIPTVVHISGRYKMDRGLKERLGEDYLERAKKDGFIDIKSPTGEVSFRVTEESLMERLNTNMHEAGLKIDPNCKVLTIHGSADEVIPVEDALEFAKIIPNHELKIIEGANHCYDNHRDKLVPAVLDFIKANLH